MNQKVITISPPSNKEKISLRLMIFTGILSAVFFIGSMLQKANVSYLPLYIMLAPHLQLKASDIFDSVYTGQMAVRYIMLDDVYSHAAFCDTISFKISLPAARSIYIGFQRNVVLDNENMIEYGNKKFPNNEVTQDDIAVAYKSQLKKAMSFAIPICVLIVIIFWIFIRKNKRMSWQSLRTTFRR